MVDQEEVEKVSREYASEFLGEPFSLHLLSPDEREKATGLMRNAIRTGTKLTKDDIESVQKRNYETGRMVRY